MIKKISLAAILTLSFFSAPCHSADLIYRGQEGEVRYYHTDVSVDIVTKVDDVITRNETLPHLKASTGDDKQLTTVLCTLPGDAIMREVKQLKSELTLKADDKTLPLPALKDKYVSPWQGPVTVGMTPQGAIIGLYGTEEIIAKIPFGGGKTLRQKSLLALEDDLKKSFGQMFPVFPEKDIVRGESWTYSLEDVKMPGLSPQPLDLVYTYTYLGDKLLNGSKCAVLKVKMHFDELIFDNLAPGNENFVVASIISGKPTSLRLDSFEGRLYFDYRQGRIRKTDSIALLIMGLDIPANEKQVFGYTAVLEMTVKSTTEMRLEP